MDFIGSISSNRRASCRDRKFNFKSRFFVEHVNSRTRDEYTRRKVQMGHKIAQLRLAMLAHGRKLDSYYSALIDEQISKTKQLDTRIKRHFRLTFFNIVLFSMVLTLTGCDTILGKKKDKDNPGEITWITTSAVALEHTTIQLKAEDPDGLKHVRVWGGMELDTLITASGTTHTSTIEKFFPYSREELPKTLTYHVEITDQKDRTTQGSFDMLITRRPNQSPQLGVQIATNQIDWIEFTITGTDDWGFDRLELDTGVDQVTINVSGEQINETYRKDYGRQGGEFNWSVKAWDDDGAVSQRSGTQRLSGRTELDLEWRTYFDEIPIDGAKIYMTHLDGLIDTVYTSQTGRILVSDLPKGEYRVLLHANPSINLASENGHELCNISRMIVKKEDLPSVYYPGFKPGQNERVILSSPGFLSNINVEYNGSILATYQILPSDLSFRLILNGDYTNLIETLENPYSNYPLSVNMEQLGFGIVTGGHLIEEYARGTKHMLGLIKLPRTDIPLIYAHNWGDKNCNSSGYDPVTEIICTPGQIPGIVINDEVKNNFDLFMTKLLGIMNDPKIKMNPYEVEIIKGYSEDISGRLITNRAEYKETHFYDRKVRNLFIENLALFSHNGNGGFPREYYESKNDPPVHIVRSLAYVGRSSPGWFSNEETFWSARERLIPVFGSVRDDDVLISHLYNAGVPDEFQVVSDNIYQAKDILFKHMIFGFFAHAQTQWVEGNGTNFLGQPGIGFNPQPFYRKDWKPENFHMR